MTNTISGEVTGMVGAHELTDALETQLSLYTELLSITRAQRDPIISGDITSLSDLVRKAESMIGDVIACEDRILRLLGSTAQGDTTDDPEAALSALVLSLSPDEREKYNGLRAQVVAVLEDIYKANTVNEALLKDALSYIEAITSLLAQGEDTVYSKLGKVNKASHRSLVDHQV